MIKTILHPDYWVEIPAGEFIAGISEEQREQLYQQVQDKFGYWEFSAEFRRQLAPVYEKFRQDPQHETLFSSLDGAEREIYAQAHHFLSKVHFVAKIPAKRVEWLDRFFIARFAVTRAQWRLAEKAMRGEFPVTELPGALEDLSAVENLAWKGWEVPKGAKVTAQVPSYDALPFLELLGGRLPTPDEWEKAARGTDGRLHPWGNEWNPDAGFFYRDQQITLADRTKGTGHVDAFPAGRSPYGLWDMAGGYPEMVEIPPMSPFDHNGQVITPRHDEFRGRKMNVSKKGWYFKDSSAASAFLHHVAAADGYGDRYSLRPVFDELP